MTTRGGDGAEGSDQQGLEGLGAVPLAEGDPRRIGPFMLAGRLGSGGMGRVFLGVADGRYAAVKQVHPHLTEDKEFVQRFGHELDNLARLPAGVSADLLDSDREGQPPWLAAAFVPGITLDEALELNGGPLPVPDVWLLLREAAAGLAVVHEIGIVHRDLKPSNVMLRQHGITLIDFGVARALEQSRLTQSGMVIGTPAYMSPEQASSDRGVTEATDVFALGCLLGYAATGTPPYGEGGGVQMLYRIVHEEPDLAPLRAVDEELADLVGQCLARSPQDRPTSSELVAQATRHVGLDVTPWPSGVRERLAVRAEAVQHVPDAATTVMAPAPPVPDGPAGPVAPGAVAAASEQVVAASGGAREKPERRRVGGVLIPLLVAAGAGAVALVPYVMNQHGGGTPSASGSGTTSTVATVGTPSGSTSASASASASTSGSPTPSAKAGASSSPHANGGGGGGPSGGAGNSSGDTGGSSGVKGTGGSNASGGSSGGHSTTSGTSGTSGGTSGGTPRGGNGGGITASGTHRLRSAQDGTCLAQSPNHSTSAYLAPCASGDPFRWTYTAVSGGSFELLNPGTGQCLAGSGSNFTYMVSCGSTDADVWSFGSALSGGSTLENPAAGQCLLNNTVVGGHATLSACTSSADEAWSND